MTKIALTALIASLVMGLAVAPAQAKPKKVDAMATDAMAAPKH